MKVYRSKIISKPIYQGNQVVAKVQDLSIDLDSGKLMAIVGDDKLFDVNSILTWQPIKVSVPDASHNKLESLKDLGDSRLHGQFVYTVNDKLIGKLVDYQVDLEQMLLSQIVVKPKRRTFFSFWSKRRYFPFQQIYSISPQKIVVKNDFAQEKSTVEAFSAAY